MDALAAPPAPDATLVLDAADFPSEGPHSAALFLVRAHETGWRSFTVFNLRGQRFIGSGFGPEPRSRMKCTRCPSKFARYCG